jgi:hypothetical protein
MTGSGWKRSVEDLLDGVERELGASPPIRAHLALEAFRKRLADGRITRRREKIEQDLETYLESEPFLKVAANRHLRKIVVPAVKEALEAIALAETVLAKAKTKKRA